MRLSIFEPPRFFEALLRGRGYEEAPDITPRELLVCDLQTVSVAGIDDTAGPYGSKLYRSSTPDLIVWARFDGYALTRGPRSSTTRATFSFPTELHEGDPVVFTFGDHDFFSENDFVAKIQGNYFGKLPFEIKGKGGKANCNAVPLARLEQEAGERRVALEQPANESLPHRLPEPAFVDLALFVDAARVQNGRHGVTPLRHAVEIDVDAQPRPAKGDGFRQTGRDAAGQVALAGGRRAHPQQRRHG